MKPPAMLCLILLLGSTGASKSVLTVDCYPPVGEALQKAIVLWEKLHPEVEVRLQVQAYADHHMGLLSQLTEGSGAADVTCVEVSFAQRLSDAPWLEDLLKAPFNAGQHQASITGYPWAQASSTEGELRVFPVDIAPGTLFYRDDILRKAGVTPEELTRSWDDFLAAGVKIKERTGAFLLHDAAFLVDIQLRATVPPGETLYFDQKGKPTLTTRRFVEAFTLAKKVQDLGLAARVGAWSPEWTRMLGSGEIATQPFGAWFEGLMEELLPENRGLWRVAPMPGNLPATLGGDFLALPVQGKQKALAWDFVQFVGTNPQAQLAAFSSGGLLPVLKTAQQSRGLWKPFPYLGMQTPQRMWVELAHQVPPVLPSKDDSWVWELLHSALFRVLDGNMKIERALAEAEGLVFHRDRQRR